MPLLEEGKLLLDFQVPLALFPKFGLPHSVNESSMIPGVEIRSWDNDYIRPMLEKRRLYANLTTYPDQTDYDYIYECLMNMKYTLPDIDDLRAATQQHVSGNYDHGHVTARAMCSYARHAYTNYEIIVRELGQVPNRIYVSFKLLVTAEIIHQCGVNIKPIVATLNADTILPMEFKQFEEPVNIAYRILRLNEEE